MAWSDPRQTPAASLHHCPAAAERVADFVRNDPRIILLAAPQSGIVL